MLRGIEEYLALERLAIVAYYPPEKPGTYDKLKAYDAELARKEREQWDAMSDSERQEAYEARQKQYAAAAATLKSMRSSQELFADEVNDVVRMREARQRDSQRMLSLRMEDERKAQKRRKKLKTLFAPMSPKKPAPASPGSQHLTSRYSFNRASPKSASPARSQSMPSMPSPKFGARWRSTGYTQMHDESEGG